MDRIDVSYLCKDNFISISIYIKGTVMQIEKALINDRFCLSKVSGNL